MFFDTIMNSFNVKIIIQDVQASVHNGVHDDDHEREAKIKISLISIFCHETATAHIYIILTDNENIDFWCMKYSKSLHQANNITSQ